MASTESSNTNKLRLDAERALQVLSAPLQSPVLSAAAIGASSAERVAQSGEANAGEAAAAGGSSLVSALSDATAAVNQLQQNILAQIQALQNVNQSLSALPPTLAELLGRGEGGGLLGGILGGGLVSLGTAIAGLFTGGASTPPPLAVYKPPPSLSIEVANAPGLPVAVEDESGAARAAPASSSPAQSVQVTVNVSAMDSQSFLDRSSDIARALRDAMLHMDPVNDLISEL
jgi:hypothetical protein